MAWRRPKHHKRLQASTRRQNDFGPGQSTLAIRQGANKACAQAAQRNDLARANGEPRSPNVSTQSSACRHCSNALSHLSRNSPLSHSGACSQAIPPASKKL